MSWIYCGIGAIALMWLLKGIIRDGVRLPEDR
jgi:hypothetical protein